MPPPARRRHLSPWVSPSSPLAFPSDPRVSRRPIVGTDETYVPTRGREPDEIRPTSLPSPAGWLAAARTEPHGRAPRDAWSHRRGARTRPGLVRARGGPRRARAKTRRRRRIIARRRRRERRLREGRPLRAQRPGGFLPGGTRRAPGVRALTQAPGGRGGARQAPRRRTRHSDPVPDPKLHPPDRRGGRRTNLRSGKDRRRNRGGGGEDASRKGDRRGDGGVRPCGGGNRRSWRRRDRMWRRMRRVRRQPSRPLAPPRDASKEGRRVGDVHEDQGTGRGGAGGPGVRQVPARGGNRSRRVATLSARRGVRTGRSQYASGNVWKKFWELFRDREGRVRQPEGVLRRVLGEDGGEEAGVRGAVRGLRRSVPAEQNGAVPGAANFRRTSRFFRERGRYRRRVLPVRPGVGAEAGGGGRAPGPRERSGAVERGGCRGGRRRRGAQGDATRGSRAFIARDARRTNDEDEGEEEEQEKRRRGG